MLKHSAGALVIAAALTRACASNPARASSVVPLNVPEPPAREPVAPVPVAGAPVPVSRVPLFRLTGRWELIAGLTAAGFLAGTFGGERGVNWVGRMIRSREEG